jgi:hypothetical protein
LEQDIDAIPKAFPIFSMSPNRMSRRPTHPTSTDVRKLRRRLETGSDYYFGLQQDIDAILTAIPIFSMSLNRMAHTTTTSSVRFIFKSHVLPVLLPLFLRHQSASQCAAMYGIRSGDIENTIIITVEIA